MGAIAPGLGFQVIHDDPQTRARTGVITTPHGDIHTPAFIPVGTKASVKAVLPEAMAALGAQAILANAYHLYLQPGADIVDEAGGLGRFMNWPGPTYTDSGGFQVLSLGVGFKKTLAMEVTAQHDDVIADGKQRLAHVDDDGVTFKSHLDGAKHRFTPEVSMQVQAQLGADIIFAFDELTTLMNTRDYQVQSLERTRRWAQRCVVEHERLQQSRSDKPAQALFGVIQGAQHEDLRRRAARDLAGMNFSGFGIGGALQKDALGEILGWVVDELPDNKPRHLLGIGEPDDLFVAIASGADTFDCVSPSRVARNSAVFHRDGRFNLLTAASRRAFMPIDDACDCYTCGHYTRAYLHHAFKAKEMIAATLATIHNERFIVRLVDDIRHSITEGQLSDFHREFIGRYYAARVA